MTLKPILYVIFQVACHTSYVQRVVVKNYYCYWCCITYRFSMPPDSPFMCFWWLFITSPLVSQVLPGFPSWLIVPPSPQCPARVLGVIPATASLPSPALSGCHTPIDLPTISGIPSLSATGPFVAQASHIFPGCAAVSELPSHVTHVSSSVLPAALLQT